MYKILFVDDDYLLRTAMSSILKAEGFEVITNANGKECLPLALKEKPDLILLDVQLLDADGVDVCRQLKADPATRHIPVVLMTGAAFDIKIRVAGLDAGAEDYLFKPVSPKVLCSRVRSILKITDQSSL
jgi:DNA-binding response OmpR family regulator